MKKIIAGVMAITLVFGSAAVLPENYSDSIFIAANANENDETLIYVDEWNNEKFAYSMLDDGTIEITKYYEHDPIPVTDETGELSYHYPSFSIPSQIDGKHVTRIGNGAFENCTKIQEVSINGIESIGDRAFKNCSSLETVSFGAVQNIGDEAFGGCKFEDVVFENKLNSIGKNALGYSIDSNGKPTKIDNFKIVSYSKDGAVVTYAESNDIELLFGETLLSSQVGELDGNDANGDYEYIKSYEDGIYVNKHELNNDDTYKFIINWYIYDVHYAWLKEDHSSNAYIDKISYVKESNGFLYAEENGYASICGYTGDSTDITIPETINGLTVKMVSTPSEVCKAFYPGEFEFTEMGMSKYTTSLESLYFIFTNEKVADADMVNIHLPDTVEQVGRAYYYGDKLHYKFSPSNMNGTINFTYASGSAAENFFAENANTAYFDDNITYGSENAANDQSEFQHTEVTDGIEITGNTVTGDTIKIPETIDNKNVVSIGSWAFAGMEIKSVEMPYVLKSIGEYAFFNCPALTNVTIPKNVENIGDYSLGYYLDEDAVSGSSTIALAGAMNVDTSKIKKVDGFKIYCYTGTAGEKYAVDNGFDYVLLDKSDEETNTSSKSETSSNNTNTSSTANPNTGAAAGLSLAALVGAAVVVTKRRK